ncbi:MAG: hypothetical protein LC774_00195 [Acidobacteria bacterium]|nr:hypothetical protein [Acidobacteriota bacterium]MCA1633717.1 hypothetical protein [Acidobacteriota bacterium]
MKRWSKLQEQIYNLLLPELELQIHCAAYPMRSQYGSTDLGRYWITLGREIIWDYPKDFAGAKRKYPYTTDIAAISELVREYVDTPVEALLRKRFDQDLWGLTAILKAADRRLGRERLTLVLGDEESEAARRVLARRAVTDAPQPQSS